MLVMQTGHAMAAGARRSALICNRCTTAQLGRRAISTNSRHRSEKGAPLWRTCPEYASTVHAASNASMVVVARPTEPPVAYCRRSWRDEAVLTGRPISQLFTLARINALVSLRAPGRAAPPLVSPVVPGGVVVMKHDCGYAMFEGGLDHLACMDGAGVSCAAEQILHGDETVAAVEVNDSKYLVVQRA